MKRILICMALCIMPTIFFAQVPDVFNYQAVIRDNSGELLTNQNIGMKISILDVSSSGSVLYSETHTIATNAYGIVNIKIGEGTLVSGDLSSVDWGLNDKFLNIEIDVNGGSSYTPFGAVQLLSVPYALYANSANNIGDENIYSPATDTLFVVKDNDGNVVFAVFPDGAAVYVNETAKGKVGGFAVSGRTSTKGIEEEYLIVTPDSTRIYINEDTTGKGKVGGFAVSGRTSTKGTVSSLMNLTKDNYFIGHEAGANNTTGLYNTFIGYNSGYTNTEGDRNIFMGYYSGYSNINGYYNLFIGDSTGYSNTSGIYNVFLGNFAGKSNTEGFQNIAIGAWAGYENTTGNRNVCIGTGAGQYNTEGEMNTFMGNLTGRFNLTGSRNIFLGSYAGYNNTTGNENILIGNTAGYSNTTADNNIFIGNSAGKSNLTGSENIFIGLESGFNNTIGIFNTCIGYQSGYALVDTSNYNTFLGFWSGRNNTTGDLNTYIGAQAGEFATDGNLNTIVGAYAGSEDTLGSFNTFIGMRAGSGNSGHSNTLLGGFAGVSNSDGYSNVFIGTASGGNSSGSENIFIGNEAGYKNNGNRNVFIGYYAGYHELGSEKLYVHNSGDITPLIYGEFDNRVLRFNGNVGIGKYPNYALDIDGDLNISGSIISNGPLEVDGIKFLNSFGPDSNYMAEGNYMAFGHTGISEDFIGYENNTFYFLDSPGGGDILDPNIVFGGNVRIYDSLVVNGTACFKQVGSGGINDVGLTADGDLATMVSDKRLKTNIQPLNGGLSKVLKLNGYTFNWKSENDSKTDAGLIAQEVLDIFPEAVFINPYDGYYGINYSRFPALFVEAFKDQQTQIDELKKENKVLKQKLEEIIKLLEKDIVKR